MSVSLCKARDRSRLTATSLGSTRRCPRPYFYRYELGLSRVRKSTSLRFGAAFHHGLELYNKSGDAAVAIPLASIDYVTRADWTDPTAWEWSGKRSDNS